MGASGGVPGADRAYAPEQLERSTPQDGKPGAMTGFDAIGAAPNQPAVVRGPAYATAAAPPPAGGGGTVATCCGDQETMLSWVFFGLGFVTLVMWAVGIFRPCCRHPRFPSKSSIVAWWLSLLMLIVYIGLIIVLVVVLVIVNKDACDSYGCYYIYK